ncbi:hypothetical protein ASG87_09995 [Frateuria sp. Soil773]|nr:hypothetical protein ASG87_09995 [Frateuria sp. Soil773]
MLFGCVLALGSAGVAVASDVDTRDLIGDGHSSLDGGGREGSVGSNDPTALNRDCPASSGSAGGGSASMPASGGGGSGGSRPAGHRSLGWQSLLPGSIQ